MFESKDRTGDERLAEFVTKVTGTIGCLDENLLRRLIEPGTLAARIAGHIHRSSCDGPRAYATTHTVANLAAGTCGSTIERFNSRGEVMCLSLDADDTLNILNDKVIAGSMVSWSELLHYRTFSESHIILIGRDNLVRILLRSTLDHRKEATGHLLAIDDKGSAENLMTTMLAVDLCETEDLAVCQLAAQLPLNLVKVFYLFGGQSQAFLLIIFFQILNLLNGCRFDIDREDFLIKTFIKALEHWVIISIFILNSPIFLNTFDAGERHVLRDLNGIGAPRGNHFPAGTYEIAVQR